MNHIMLQRHQVTVTKHHSKELKWRSATCRFLLYWQGHLLTSIMAYNIKQGWADPACYKFPNGSAASCRAGTRHNMTILWWFPSSKFQLAPRDASCTNTWASTTASLMKYTPWNQHSAGLSVTRKSGLWFNIKTRFPGIGIPIMKIRRSSDHLIFIMGIPKLVRSHLYIESGSNSDKQPLCWWMQMCWLQK